MAKVQRSANAGPLELYTLNLNAEAQKGKTDPLIGREKEIERTAQILCRRRKNNPFWWVIQASVKLLLPKVWRG